MSDLSRINTVFTKYGFKYRYSDNDTFLFSGKVCSEKYGAIYIDFIVFTDFLDFPDAIINEKSRDLFIPYHFPHLEADWKLCYHDNSVFFDSSKPELYIPFSINSVRSILDQFEHDDMNEISKEFLSYWRRDDGCYYGDFDENQDTLFINNRDIFDNNRSGNNKEILYVKLDMLPTIKGIEWPLKDIENLVIWLNLSEGESNRIRKFIKSKLLCNTKESYILIYVRSHQLFLGIKLKQSSGSSRGHSLKPSTVESILRQKAYTISRFIVKQIKPKNIILSNYDNTKDDKLPTLFNKKIALIGLGTLGSNLANILLRNGAGMLEGGLLSLIDYDRFEPENFSRHFLGLDSVGLYKADKLKNELSGKNKFAKIVSIIDSVKNVDLRDYDIIIDTTGEESLAIYLARCVPYLKENSLLVSIWISEAGKKAEAFAQPIYLDSACHECFRLTEDYTAHKKDNYPMRDSCQSVYIPFPITASLQASILAVNIIDVYLLKSLNSSMYFYQNIDPIDRIIQKSIERSEFCHICGKN